MTGGRSAYGGDKKEADAGMLGRSIRNNANSISSGEGCQLTEVHSLISEPWYWPGASKNDLAKALEKKQDGTFVVRDASTPGDFTLTVRAGGETKLVKIHVSGGMCGFNLHSLEFNSIQQLIETHKTVSLKSYNAHLDTKLLFPLRDSRRRHSGDEEFEQYLAIERLRTCSTAFHRAAKIVDIHYGEQIRAENLHRAQVAALADVNKKMELLKEVASTQKELLSEPPSASSNFAPLDADKRLAAFDVNSKVIDEFVMGMREEASTIEGHISRIKEFMTQQAVDLKHESDRLTNLSVELDQLIGELGVFFQSGKDEKEGSEMLCDSRIRQLSEHFAMRQAHETIALARLLNEMPLKWDPAKFLVNDPSKEAAAALIESARVRLAQDFQKIENGKRRGGAATACSVTARRPSSQSFDGIFLIRPSATQKGKLVLSVLVGGRISHCLIEEAEQGWGFENSGLYFASIGDFVRYYSHVSLEEHNKAIRTTLMEPAVC